MKEWEFTAKDGRSINIRHAVAADAKLLHAGFEDVIEEGQWLPTFKANSSIADWVNWIQKTQRSRDILIVAEIEGEYAGHLTLQPEEWMASQHVAKLGIIVQKHMRGYGVGTALMKAAEDAAREEEFHKIVLSTFESNSIACSLYLTLGYREVGRRERHFMMPKGYIAEVLFEKELIS
ncbi:MAG: GNAT family N-acetyltransferase [Candidatus Hodarchaeota archaeon]